MEVFTETPEQTQELGRKIGEMSRPGDILWLIGELGTGKTLFTKGIARSVGITSDEITSPSYTLEKIRPFWPLDHIIEPALSLHGPSFPGVVATTREQENLVLHSLQRLQCLLQLRVPQRNLMLFH